MMKPEKDLSGLTDELTQLSVSLLSACRERQFDSFLASYAKQETCLQQLHDLITGEPGLTLAESEREVLQQVLESRQNMHLLVEQWMDSLKVELQALNQSSRLLKTYSA